MNTFEFVTTPVPHYEQPLSCRMSAEPSELRRKAQEICSTSILLEELLYRLVREHFTVGIIHVQEDGLLALHIEYHVGGRIKDLPIGLTFVDAEQIKRKYRPKLIPRPRTDASKRLRIDDAWFDARRDRLKLKCTSHHGAVFAPAGSLVELVLSYAFVPWGAARLSNEIEEGDNYSPRFCAKLLLTWAPPDSKQVVSETIFVRLDRLSRLVDQRIAKEELKALPREARH